MRLILKIIIFVALGFLATYSYSQPIPVEFMAGNRYATVNVVMSKNFTENSKLDFFHLNTFFSSGQY